jgi:peptide/nickel transport system permease protein
MRWYVLRRLIGSILVFFVVASLVFVMIQFAPGDPAQIYLGRDTDPAALAAVRHQFGLDRPLVVQWGKYLWNVVRGDLGVSLFTRRSVNTTLGQVLPPSIELAFFAVLWSSALAILLGVVAAARRGASVDGAIRLITLLAISLPNFWLGLMLLLIFGLYVPGILPAGGWVPFTQDPIQNLHHIILPAFVLGLANLAIVTRILRASMLDALKRDYVTFGRAMGVPERQVLRDVALPNAILPTTTVIGLAAAALIGGAVITEVVFTIPGVGQTMVTSFQRQDYPVAIGCTLVVAFAYVLVNFTVDILYTFFNPQVRRQFVGGKAVTDG